MAVTTSGRPRDLEIDRAVLSAVREHLAVHGLAGLSIAAVAEDAGTTRATIYRRWPDKLTLALASIADLAEKEPPKPTDNPLKDLIAELTHFRQCITDASSLALAGVMLQNEIDPKFQRSYRKLLVEPRRARILACLERGILKGQIAADSDIAVAASFATGSWYAFSISGNTIPKDWAERTAQLIWKAVAKK